MARRVERLAVATCSGNLQWQLAVATRNGGTDARVHVDTELHHGLR